MKLLDNEVLFCDNHILAAVKRPNLLTQADQTGAFSLEELAKEWVKKKFHKPGNVFLHAVHRLDKAVSGIVLFARTSKALSRLNEAQRNFEIQKFYTAEVEGTLSILKGELEHFLIHGNHRGEVVSSSHKDAKKARLTYTVLEKKTSSTLILIELETGRYHQIRAQFSAIGHPIVGDGKYGARAHKDAIHLHASKLAFKHPVTKELLEFISSPPFS